MTEPTVRYHPWFLRAREIPDWPAFVASKQEPSYFYTTYEGRIWMISQLYTAVSLFTMAIDNHDYCHLDTQVLHIITDASAELTQAMMRDLPGYIMRGLL